MLVLVLGLEKNGKSWYAEALAARLARGKLYYIATFIPVGDGEWGASRVNRHRKHREGAGFETVEKPARLYETDIESGSTVLLEDTTNLLANYMFMEGGGVDNALNDVISIKSKCEHVIAVSLSGLVNSGEFDEATNRYIAAHDELNGRLYELSDAVVVVENRKVSVIKGTQFEML